MFFYAFTIVWFDLRFNTPCCGLLADAQMVLRWKSTRRCFRPIRLLSWRVKWSIELEPSRRQLWSMGGRWPERSENAGSRELDLQINCSTLDGERNPTNVTTVRLCSLLPCTQCEETRENIYCRQAHYVQCSICNALVGSKGERRGRDLRTLEQSRVLNCVWSAPAPQVTIDDCNGLQNVLLFCHLALNSLLESNFEILRVVCSQLWILAFKIFADNSDNCWRSTFSKE